MSEEEYKKFCERYNRFKKNNLPTPFWDEERQIYEYVYFYNGKSFLNSVKTNNKLEVNTNLNIALSNITCTGLYYPFTSKRIQYSKENEKIIKKVVIGDDHAHSFDEVINVLYDCPESFNISKEDEEFYSKQELKFIRRIQKYLLFIGMKDLETNRVPVSRYRNKIHSKYESALIHKFSNTLIKDILDGKRNFNVIDWYPEYTGDEKYKPCEFRALIVDEEDNFKMFVEYTKSEAKYYKDIKEIYLNDKLIDDNKVILQYFKVLEIF